jgi:NADPH:quinone reductase
VHNTDSPAKLRQYRVSRRTGSNPGTSTILSADSPRTRSFIGLNDAMKALRFEKTGSLDGLSVRDIPVPRPAAGEALVQVKAAAINPSDIKNVQGKMHGTTVPRTPGRDFAGIVVEGPKELVGASVFGSGGNLGFGRDGSHAEFLTLPEVAILPLPRNAGFEQGAGIGVAYMTAWAAIVNTARIQSGETVLITGTTGNVGGIAARIAHRLGARVLGTVRSTAELATVGDLPVEKWIDLQTKELADGVRVATAGRGADVVFDVIGGSLFEKCLQSLAWRGRQVAIASNPEARVNFNLVDFYHNESRLLGVDSLKLGFEEAAGILRSLTPLIESGELPLPKVQAYPLARAPEIYRGILAATIKGKPVLVP